MMKYICTICGYIYDEDKENVSFQDLANDWVCPLCKAPKTLFKAQQSKEKQTDIRVPQHLDEDWQELSAMQLSALFSNLARGLEKQYQDEAVGTGHILVPMIRCLQSACPGQTKQWGHFGATTQDIVDTGNILQMREATQYILQNILRLEKAILKKASDYKCCVMAGRKHAQQASPITLLYPRLDL